MSYGDEEYRKLGHSTLAAFQEAVASSSYLGPPGSRRMEEDEERLFFPAGAAWGRAWNSFIHGPVHMVLVGDPTRPQTRSLLRGAHRLYTPHQVVQLLNPGWDGDRIRSLGFPPRGEPTIYVCLGERCLAPISTARELMELRRTLPWRMPEKITP